jgi:mono/diheme cytochrome c family protein
MRWGDNATTMMHGQKMSRAVLLTWFGVLGVGVGYPHEYAQAARGLQNAAPAPRSAIGSQAQTSGPRSAAVEHPRAVLEKSCVTCHNERLKTAGLTLDKMDVERIGDGAEVWEKVARKFRTQEMPPPGRPRPDQATYGAIASFLEKALDDTAAAKPNPGSVAVHRLNRAEYANAVRDLLGLEVDAQSLLAADEPDHQSFDNIASVLSVSPALLDGYLSAAAKVSRLAVGDPTIIPVVDTYDVPAGLNQDDRINEDLPFGSQGGTAIRHHFPLDGEYKIKVLLRRQIYLYIIGMGEPHQMEVRVDGALVKRFTVGGEGKGMTTPESFVGNTQGDPAWEVYMQTADAGLEVRVPLKAGTREVGVSFVRNHWEPEGVLQPPQRGFARTSNELYYGKPAVAQVLIQGPYEGVRADDTPSRRKVFVCRPSDSAAEEPCAKQILSTLARRAYRRPVTEEDVRTLLSFYKTGRAEGGFDVGIQRGLERILAGPSFLFRIERQPAHMAPGTVYRLSDLELASRLSFFLWSSIPDDELLDLANRGRLKDPQVLEQQVRRLLDDPRSKALVDNFANQWLKLGKIAGVVPDANAQPDFDENLREAMQLETQRFILSQLREDRSVMDLLTANYTYVNERLARHYRIPDIYGNHLRRVTFTDGVRGGLLGQASILTVTSYPDRTSPVVRGKWLLENMLGAPPPPPPPDVPALKESGTEGPRSVRQRMEAHRRNPACAVCHVRMDPLGFSLENFDSLGKWRTVSDGAPIDAAAALPDGTQFEGVAGLRQLLVSHRDDFLRTFTEKLLAYSIGRGVEYYDLPAVRKITREAAANNYRWSSLIAGIVRSTPFTMGIVKSAPSEYNVAKSDAGSSTLKGLDR